MTIPLSLIGQMWLNEQYSNGIYWVGALVVVGSFVFVNHESKDEDEKGATVVVVGESSAGMQTPRIVVIAAEGDVEGEELV